MTSGDLRLGARLDRIEEKLDAVRLDVATLKAKSRIWGGLLGAVTGAAVAILAAFISA